MNSRLRPESLTTDPYREWLRQLALGWTQADLSASSPYRYQDYLALISTLLLTTQSLDQTIQIVKAVLAQAVALGKASEWVEAELKLEGMLTGVDRADFLLLELQQAGRPDDDLLDSYNERLNRFIDDGH